MKVTLACAPAARQTFEESFELPEGCSLRDALVHTGWRRRFALDRDQTVEFGIWNRSANLYTTLRDGDRVEVYRPLQVDPKVARRERFQRQGSSRAGLFAQRRQGAKPGY